MIFRTGSGSALHRRKGLLMEYIKEEVVEKDGMKCCGRGTLELRKGIHILHLRGTYGEMGRQHGRLAQEVCGDMVLRYFDDVIETLIKHSAESIANPASRLLKWLFYVMNSKRLGAEMREHCIGFDEALGAWRGRAERVAVVPDIIHFLIGKTFPAMAVPPSCSSFMARDSATAAGKLLVGRNFDFFGQGVWDANNTFIFMEPDDGMKYCWIGAMGVPGSGQGMNEAGLIVGLHTKFNRDVRLTGIPVFTLVGNILARCKSLDEATKMIAAQPRICGLAIFIVDSKARDAVAAGFSANFMEIDRPENDVLVHTNHYISKEMKKYEVAPYCWRMHSESRHARIHELVEQMRGSLAPADVPRIMSDCVDYFEGKRRIAGNIVGATNNSQSVVFSPDDDSMWIANGDFPVCMSDIFHGFRISALFDADRDNYEIADIPGAGQLDDTERAAQRHYQEAWVAHFDNFRDDLAVFHLRRASELVPDEPVYSRLVGFIMMKQGQYEQALPFFVNNAQYDYKVQIMKAESELWLGRCLDLAGQRGKAVDHYRVAAQLDAQPVSAAAGKNINSPFRASQLKDVAPEFVVGTVLAKY